MKKLNQTLLLFLLTFTSLFLQAQVKTKVFNDSIPQSLKPNKVSISKLIHVETPNSFEQLKKGAIETSDSARGRRNKFAVSHPVNIDFIGTAERRDENSLTTFSITIVAKQALNISLEFTDFELPPNAILSVFTKKELTDSITYTQNNSNRLWATRVYQGNTVNLVMTVPTAEILKSSLKISKVNFGYKRFGAEFGNPGASPNCNTNIICAGNAWENERNSVSLIVANGDESCTGALIMNACGTNIPYFLTANHCLDENVTNWVFQFQYWSSSCTPNAGWNEDIQFNGCLLRANNAASDFALLQLNQTPPPNSNIRYAGWSRQTTGINNATIIHHPRGDLMKISVDNNAPTTINIEDVDSWELNLDAGATDAGTSGAPYFNQDHRIIAQHYGTGQLNLPVCDRTEKYGGRFDLSWTGGGTNATRLSNWLDPFNTGAIATNTTNVSNLVAPPNTWAIAGDNIFCTTSNSYTISNMPPGLTVQWQVSPFGIATVNSPNSTQTTLSINGDGIVTLTAIINFCSGQITISKPNIVVGAGPAPTITHVNFDRYCGTFAEAHSSLVPQATGYVWDFNYGTVIQDNDYPAGNYFYIAPAVTQPQPGFYYYNYLSVQAKNICGVSVPSTVRQFTIGPINSNNCGGNNDLLLSPNPSESGSTTVAIKDNKFGNNKDIKQVKLLDKMGTILRQWSYGPGTKKATLNVSGLSPDIYIISATSDGKEWLSTQLQVQ